MVKGDLAGPVRLLCEEVANAGRHRVEIQELIARVIIKKPSGTEFSFYIDDPIKITIPEAGSHGAQAQLIGFHSSGNVPSWHLGWKQDPGGQYILNQSVILDLGDEIELPPFSLTPTEKDEAIELLDGNTAVLSVEFVASTDRGTVVLGEDIGLELQEPQEPPPDKHSESG